MHEDLYRQEILEHYHHPQNYGRLKKFTAQAHKPNPLCGDEITLQLLISKSKKVVDAGFTGSGCALSMASASIFFQNIRGKNVNQLKRLKPNQVIKLLRIDVSPARRKCALLPFDALQEIFNSAKPKDQRTK